MARAYIKLKHLVALAVLTASILVVACDPENVDLAGGGIGGSGVTSGPISGFGSVFVNGLEIDTSNASFTINGVTGNEDMLDVGMVVTVYGDLDNDTLDGTATHVAFDFDVIGLVEAIDKTLNHIEVAGQSVTYDDLTIFKSTDEASLQIGDYIAISGLSDADSHVLARYITTATPGEYSYQGSSTGGGSGSTAPGSNSSLATIEGFVQNLDIVNRRFNIGSLVVDYTSAQFVDIEGAAIKDGLAVRVTGNKGATLHAAYIQATGIASALRANKDVIVDGFVTGLDLPDGFALKGSPIVITPDTEFDNGKLADIVLNKRVKVVGRSDDQNRIVAGKISFLPPAVFLIVADVTSVNLVAREFSLLGIDVTVNSSTAFLDRTLLGLRRFSLKDVGIGDRIAVIGFRSGAGIIARRVDRLPGIFSNAVVLRGPVALSSGNTEITVLDKTIDISRLRDNQDFLDAAGTPISRQDLVSQVAVDSLVVVEGTYNGVTIDPTRIAIQ